MILNKNFSIDFGSNEFKRRLKILLKSKESSKFEKKEKYNFDDKENKKREQIEAVKDICSIANSPPVGNFSEGYIFLGISDSGAIKGIPKNRYKEVDFIDLIEKYVSPEIKIEYAPIKIKSKYVGVIYIPASLNKPHLIKKDMIWKNNRGNTELFAQRGICFTRHSSKVVHALKEDFDEIYDERKELEQGDKVGKRIEKEVKPTISDEEIEKLLKKIAESPENN